MKGAGCRGRDPSPFTLHAVVILLAACHPPARLTVELTDSVAGIVLVNGVQSPEQVIVRVGEGMPPLAGESEVVNGAVRFTPRFPPEGISALIVSVGERRWTLPLAVPAAPVPSTRVVAIHPSAPVLPANQLRWYVEFSAPMREGSAHEHVRLRDQQGKVVDHAFLAVDEELWDPTRTRLTLMLDMGRVKQGIKSRADLGAVLYPGRRYALEIDSGWVDARGATLVTDTAHRFSVAGDWHDALDPARWRISAISPGTQAPLRIEFGVTLDHALAERMIIVTSADGERVGGSVRLLDHDRALEFVPSVAWGTVKYQLRVHPALEDVAGNRIGHAFDAVLAKGERAGVGEQEVILPIRAD